MNLSEYQQNILGFFKDNPNNLTINAVAGSGKTFTLMELAKFVNNPNSISIAFNKIIADTLANKLKSQGSPMSAKTFHSLGYASVRKYISKLPKNINNFKYSDLAQRWLQEHSGIYKREAYNEVAELTGKIANFCMLNMRDGQNREDTAYVADTYDIAYDEHVLNAVPWVIKEGNDKRVLRDLGVNFTDMLWLPYYNQWELPKYDVVFADECLPYDTLIKLAEGSSKSIGDIVKNKLAVEVISFNTETKKSQICKVTGWSKKPMKQLVKIETEYCELICTEDHKIWTLSGWMKAQHIGKGQWILNLKDGRPYSRKVWKKTYVVSKEKWVYDIEVEECHNFYANGILVHNCQDFSPLSIWLAENSLAKDGRFVAAGDENQAIYGFSGSATDSFDRVQSLFNADRLPLSVCYRCGTDIVKLAKSIVPHIESPSWMHQGSVSEMTSSKMINSAQSGDAILCRVNAPLVSLCLHFLTMA